MTSLEEPIAAAQVSGMSPGLQKKKKTVLNGQCLFYFSPKFF